jgi:hypothetical protein
MKRFTLFLAALAIAFLAGCTQIDSGNVGVSVTRGNTDLNERPQGNYLTIIETLNEFTTKEVSFQLNDLKPKTANQITMADVDVDIYFKAVPGKVADTVVKYQGDVVRHKDIVPGSKSDDLIAGYNKVLREARESVYYGVSRFQANEINNKRAELADTIVRQLQSELEKSDPGVWIVTGANVRSLNTDPAIEASIRAAAETDQAIERAKKEVVLAVENAKKLKAQATGEAEANTIISNSLTPQLVRLKEIEAQRAFAGAGTHTVVMGSSAGSLVNIGK